MQKEEKLLDTAVLFSQMIQMFLMIFLGYVLRKTGLLDAGFTAKLTSLLLSVAMPCMILNSVLSQTGERNLALAGQVFLFAAVFYLALPVLALLVTKLLRLPKSQQGLYAFMMTYSNVGFMGFPLVNALYGSEAVFYTAIINILFTLTSYTTGLMLLHYGSGRRAALNPRMFLTPGVILPLVAVVIYLLDLSLPDEVVSVTGSIGNITTPLAMFCIGSTLASMSLKEVVSDWHVYLFSAVKQIALPLLLLPVLRLVLTGEYLQGIVYVLLLTPVGNTAVLFSTQYGFDEKLAARGVFVSTVLSIVTIPLLGMLL